ncbi:MAG: hypothetical protein HZB16_03150 [Armatimonadetes bacterium]|nr:hypothetical protein [Armatimonadota bacterium]
MGLLCCAGALVLGACGSTSTTIPAIDETFDFSSAGVLPGTNRRDAGRGRLAGTVRNASNQTVSGISVTLYHLINTRQAGVGHAVATTISGGTYVFGNVPAGRYRVAMQGQTTDITVYADRDSTANFAGATGGTTGGSGRKWTVIVYMDGDNDLETYSVADANELERLPASDEVTFVVLWDRIRGYDSTNGNWTDARRFVIQHDTDTNIVTSALLPSEGGNATVMGELDMGSATTLRDFVNWAQTNYPADHYLVDLWNHGSGWRPVNRSAQGQRGINYDDTSGSFLATHNMDDALAVSQPLDVVAMDASLMQMAEVVYQMRNSCDYVVGSEESPPGEGYPYHLIFSGLVSNPDISADQVCRNIVTNYVNEVGGRSSVTQSAFQCSQLEALTGAITNYAQALTAKNATFHDQIALARTDSQRYGSGSSLYEGNRDLIDFINRVNTRTGDAALLAAGNTVKNALSAAMLQEGHSGTDLANSKGLAIWIPASADWVSIRSSYRLTDFGINGAWDDWLDTFYSIGG